MSGGSSSVMPRWRLGHDLVTTQWQLSGTAVVTCRHFETSSCCNFITEEATSRKRKRAGVSGPATVEEVLGSAKPKCRGGVRRIVTRARKRVQRSPTLDEREDDTESSVEAK